ncbi:hypothetical protein L9F63_003423 [Diploptera punctata]|uniref:G-protein coupled receptors family 1 profile domain-containing protein n=1 Tax=Diploptera punctata TaxID=6984 RepID=A0AAD7ZK92_DIPPU|nr:hypothetical protein L9F63_003423 [Diploptera punctata]
MMILITFIEANSFTTTDYHTTKTTQPVVLENYKISTQQPQTNKITISSLQINGKNLNNNLTSRNITNKSCNADQDFSISEISKLEDLIESQLMNISVVNITVTQIFDDFENQTLNFMDSPDTDIGNSIIALGKDYIANTSYLLVSIERYNSLVHALNCRNKSEGIKFDDIPIKQIEDEITYNKHIIRQFEYIYNLIIKRTNIYFANEAANEFLDEYNSKRNLTYIEKAIKGNENIILLLEDFVPYLKEYEIFMGNEQLHESFNNPFTQHVTDRVYWEELVLNITKEIERNKVFLSEESYRILIQEKIQPAIQGIIFIIGLVGNVILMIIFARHEEIRCPPNMMILNLAIGDVLNLIINIPTFYTYFVSSSWDYGDGLCKGFRFFRQVGIVVSIYSVVMISIQRFIALKHLFSTSTNAFIMSSKMKSALVILSVWVLAMLLATPHTIHAGVYNGNCYGASIELHSYYSTFITLFDFILFCTIPVIIIITLSLSSSYAIKTSVKNMPGESMGMDHHIKSRIVSSNILIGLSFVSAVSYIPLYLFMFIYAWSDIQVESSTYIAIYLVLHTLTFANCCFNPISLYIFSKKFRRYFNRYLICSKLKDVSDTSKQTSTGTNSSNLETKL